MKKSMMIMLLATSSATQLSHAALVEVDSGFGLNSGTLDTDTNLEWLDWTQTADISFNDMVPQLLAGGTYDGWRYATAAEVDTLYFSSAGINPLAPIETRAAQILSLQGLLGQTSSSGTLGEGGFAGSSSYGMFGDAFGLGRAMTELVVRTQDGPYSLALATPVAGSISDSFATTGTGHILVREVPTPGALALLGLGGIMTTRRRR